MIPYGFTSTKPLYLFKTPLSPSHLWLFKFCNTSVWINVQGNSKFRYLSKKTFWVKLLRFGETICSGRAMKSSSAHSFSKCSAYSCLHQQAALQPTLTHLLLWRLKLTWFYQFSLMPTISLGILGFFFSTSRSMYAHIGKNKLLQIKVKKTFFYLWFSWLMHKSLNLLRGRMPLQLQAALCFMF